MGLGNKKDDNEEQSPNFINEPKSADRIVDQNIE